MHKLIGWKAYLVDQEFDMNYNDSDGDEISDAEGKR